jgi:hypothetical protein
MEFADTFAPRDRSHRSREIFAETGFMSVSYEALEVIV